MAHEPVPRTCPIFSSTIRGVTSVDRSFALQESYPSGSLVTTLNAPSVLVPGRRKNKYQSSQRAFRCCPCGSAARGTGGISPQRYGGQAGSQNRRARNGRRRFRSQGRCVAIAARRCNSSRLRKSVADAVRSALLVIGVVDGRVSLDELHSNQPVKRWPASHRWRHAIGSGRPRSERFSWRVRRTSRGRFRSSRSRRASKRVPRP